MGSDQIPYTYCDLHTIPTPTEHVFCALPIGRRAWLCRQPAPEPPGTGNRDPRRNLLRFLINLVRIQHILGPSYPGG